MSASGSGVSRRTFLMGTLAVAAGAPWPVHRWNAAAAAKGDDAMYGLIGQMVATPGKRDELAEILVEGTAAMPGCLSYVVARDVENEDALWITEVWESQESHEASLSLPDVQEAIARGRPFIAGFGQRYETVPMGGVGLERVR